MKKAVKCFLVVAIFAGIANIILPLIMEEPYKVSK